MIAIRTDRELLGRALQEEHGEAGLPGRAHRRGAALRPGAVGFLRGEDDLGALEES